MSDLTDAPSTVYQGWRLEEWADDDGDSRKIERDAVWVGTGARRTVDIWPYSPCTHVTFRQMVDLGFPRGPLKPEQVEAMWRAKFNEVD